MKSFLIALIGVYRRYFSKFYEGVCIYTPSCSEYSIQALEKYGAVKGIVLTARRLLRCRSSYKGGYDPVK